MMIANIEIIIGTYEEFLLGYKFIINNEIPTLSQSFADKSHSGSIRCVAVREHWLASGGLDDRIFIYDMNTRKQSQILLSHRGTINSLVFTPDGTHILSGGDDGRMIATRLKTWFTEASWEKAHNGYPVTHISCHPSGKLALSLGSDLVIRTWNLIKGRVAYKTNLKGRNTLGPLPDCLVWSPAGDYFTISGQRVVEFWSIKTADVVRSQKTKSKPTCLTWIANDMCVVGLEDGKILWLSLDGKIEKEIEAHNARVKAIDVFKQYLVSASSSGEIKVWQIFESKQELKEISKTNIGCRPTCISILDLEQLGTNYLISDTLEFKQNDLKPTASKSKMMHRGIVTAECENEDNFCNEERNGSDEKRDQEEGDNGNDEGEDIEDETDSEAEKESEDDDADKIDDIEDGDDKIGYEDKNDNSDNSCKQKLQIVKRRKIEKKKLQVEHFNNKNKTKQTIKKQHIPEQKRDKQNYLP